MTTMPLPEVLGLPRSRPLTYDDLEALRDSVDDGHRYELVDGVLIVSPGPIHVHQRAVGNLHVLLRQTVPDDLEVLLAPFDVVLADGTGATPATVLQPDLLVARRPDVTRRNLPVAPVLAIEVLSPSTRVFDLHLKKERLRRAGCAHYWVVDPLVPSIVAWRLADPLDTRDTHDTHDTRDGATYELAGEATHDDLLTLSEPFDLRVVPSGLVDR